MVQPVVEKPVVKTVSKPIQTITVTLDDDNNSTSIMDTPTTTPISESISSVSSQTDQEMKQKIYDVLGKINKDGIDFFEVCDATEQMDGGVIPQNIKNSFIALKSASGNKLTKEYVIETAQYYRDQIQTILDSNTKSKISDKEKATTQWKQEKETLQQTVSDLTKQIEDLNNQRTQAETSLSKIDSKYKPFIQKIDDQINSGQKAVQSVSQEIQSFIDIFKQVVK